ncbi:MAG: hypothetical protein CM15mP77_0310 [Synechococcus sp.]|nr:MAG: hypothetical protein CM15mP77_0310 [Synechococcus sp.]
MTDAAMNKPGDHGPIVQPPMHPTWTEQWWPVSYCRIWTCSAPIASPCWSAIWSSGGRHNESLARLSRRLSPSARPLSEGRINDAGSSNALTTAGVLTVTASAGRSPRPLRTPNRTVGDPAAPACRPRPARGCCLCGWAPGQRRSRALPLVPALEENPESWTCRTPSRPAHGRHHPAGERLDVSHVPFTHHKTVENGRTHRWKPRSRRKTPAASRPSGKRGRGEAGSAPSPQPFWHLS